ncbi:hypothetical protein STCU_10800 [Strigomonas culicis]|uniref:Uncharacterized protein n=1 Tax=Strigomonas culicis TaxID=28005 RepID=S9TJY9_9TRYP|nr:hypothetical protein STCU_10800 [Strigomonas culicis]|eukprot:EPY17124.1 hypothetical protein STCU_10800 [Strigomonas culicis]
MMRSATVIGATESNSNSANHKSVNDTVEGTKKESDVNEKEDTSTNDDNSEGTKAAATPLSEAEQLRLWRQEALAMSKKRQAQTQQQTPAVVM